MSAVGFARYKLRLAAQPRTRRIDEVGPLERETIDAAARFAAALRQTSGRGEFHPDVAECFRLADRAFGGDPDAWAPLVAAVGRLLARTPVTTRGGVKSRRDLRAFVAENADLLEP